MSVANYERFQDESFALRIGGDIDRTLTANIQNTPIAGEGAILMWKHWRAGSGSVSYRVSVNGVEVSTPTISDDTPPRNFTSLHEVIGVNNISSGENNVEFRVTDGSGTLRIADVVIFYLQGNLLQTTAADYERFQDRSFALRIGDDIDRNLTANIQNTPIAGESAILMWKHWRADSGSVSYRVSVNGVEVSTPKISDDTPPRNFTSLHEFIGVNNISSGENNVEFRVTDGSATLRIADVVIFYRRALDNDGINQVVAGYELFQDRSFALEIGNVQIPGNQPNRTLTDNVEDTPRSGEGAILMWKHWRAGSGSATYQVSVNESEVSNPTISNNTAPRDFTSLHEFVGVNDINSGENNVEFRLMDGSGTLRIADVILFYRNVAAFPEG